MGRQAAGQGFLRAYVQASQEQNLAASAWVSPPLQQAANAAVYGFKQAGLTTSLEVVSSANMDALSQSGCLYVPQPGLAELASQRIRFGERKFSLCGITHTIASHSVMTTLAQLPLVPLRPWDALICSSSAVLQSVQQLVGQQFEYLKWKLGATRMELPQLPVIPLGVHVSDYEFSCDQKESARQQLGLGANDVAILFVGRLSFHAKAHPHPMLAALQNVARNTSKKIHLIQAGWFANDPIGAAFKEAGQVLAPDVRHHFLDGRDTRQRDTAWACADIFCSFADNIQETFGLTPIEAMAASLPVVVSDWDGYKDTVRHEIDGFRIRTCIPVAGDGNDLATLYERGLDNYDMYCGKVCEFVAVDIAQATQSFQTLVDNADLRTRMGKAAHERAVQEYEWRNILQRYQQLWHELSEMRLATALQPQSVNPLNTAVDRPDPYELFSGYASKVVDDQTRMRLEQRVDENEFRKIAALAVHKYATTVLPDWAQAEAIFQKLAVADASVAELVEGLNSLQKSRLRRYLLWMMKVGWLSIV